MKWLVSSLFVYITFDLFSQTLDIEKTNEGLWILENGEKVLFYQSVTKSLNGQYSRADYVHPLYGIDGFDLTEDFPSDHLHHRGVFWAWHRVIIDDKLIGDAWECKDFTWDVKDVSVSNLENKSLTLTSKVLWKSPLWIDKSGQEKAFVEENLRITVFKKAANYRIFDFEISLLAQEENMKIAGSDDEKGYSGFSVRMKMPGDLLFSSAQGTVTPKINQVEAGNWINMSGTLTNNSEKAGIVIIQHPENPHYPERWIIRKQGSMQNPVYPGREPVALSNLEPTILRYRLVIYIGDLSNDTIEKLATNQK